MAGGLKRLTPLHYDAMHHRLEGLTYREIGDILNRTEGTVRGWFCAEPVFRDAYAAICTEAKEQALAILYAAGPSAAKRVVLLQDARSEMVGLTASKDVLDRIGLNPVERRAMTNTAGEDAPLTVEHHHVVDLDALSDDELNLLARIYGVGGPLPGDDSGGTGTA